MATEDQGGGTRTARGPVGTVTLVFTDIEGSTQLLQTLGARYADLLVDHHRLLGTAFREHDGTEQGTAGDGLYFTFPSARAAVSAAIAAQRSLVGHSWPDERPVRVRMGIHTGEPASHGIGYIGLDVHRAARIASVGHGGQILISRTTYDLIAGELPTDVSLTDLGEHRLKDLVGAQHLFQVTATGLPSAFPPVRTVDAQPGNLPRQLTTFVGRERELAEGGRIAEAAPLLTLTGPGGVGKTRLALRLANDAAPGFVDGAWLVELGVVSDPDGVPQAVASALGIVEQPGRPLMASILEHLRAREALLVLDNCEHLLRACAELAHSILRECPGVRILATSQEPLAIAGEALLPVPSLSLPDAGTLDVDRLLACEAVRLFRERAQMVLPTFEIDTHNAGPVVHIVRRLDGIPLALELAAARLRSLSADQIAARLDDRFRLLTGGSRVAVARHQTLRAAMDWSYELLADDERALLRRVSVFHGGFALEAAETVAAGELVDEADVLDLLARLVDKSLVQVEARTTEQRYDLSGIVRQYADERLVESDEAFEARRRHRDWCLRLVEQAAPRLQRGPDAAMWLDRLDLEHDNLSAALDWSADQPGEAEAGLRLAEGLWRFCEIRGHLAEGRGWLERMLEAAPAADSPLRANALTGAGLLAFIQGDYAAALAFHEQSLELHRRLGDATAVAYATNNLANAALQQGDLDRARELYEQSLVLARQQDRHGYAFGLVNTADVLQRQGEYAAAQGRFRESITMFRELGDPWGEAYALDEFGRVARREGDVETARILHADALAIARSMGDQGSAARALANQADLAASEGDLSRSRMLHRESLATRMAMRDLPGVATGLERLAATIVDDDPDAAARLIGAAEALREATRARLPLASRAEHDRVVEALEATLGGEAFAAARAVGRRSSPDEVLATLPP